MIHDYSQLISLDAENTHLPKEFLPDCDLQDISINLSLVFTPHQYVIDVSTFNINGVFYMPKEIIEPYIQDTDPAMTMLRRACRKIYAPVVEAIQHTEAEFHFKY